MMVKNEITKAFEEYEGMYYSKIFSCSEFTNIMKIEPIFGQNCYKKIQRYAILIEVLVMYDLYVDHTSIIISNLSIDEIKYLITLTLLDTLNQIIMDRDSTLYNDYYDYEINNNTFFDDVLYKYLGIINNRKLDSLINDYFIEEEKKLTRD